MKTIKLNYGDSIPDDYTGIVVRSHSFHNPDDFTVKVKSNVEYYCNGQLHRDDGPAISHDNGCVNYYYWFHGKLLNKAKIEQLINLGYPEKTAIKLSMVK